MTTTHDIAALMAAIDNGDDEALPILADALEEAGDPRAEGLRESVSNPERYPVEGHTGAWMAKAFRVAGFPQRGVAWSGVLFASRAAAYMALAKFLKEAMADDRP